MSQAKETLDQNTKRIELLERTNRPYALIGDQDNNTPKVADKILKRSVKPTEDPMIGSYLKGIVTGNWSGLESEKRDAMSSVNAAGGFMLSLGVSQEVVDFARSKSVCFEAGARTLTMGEGAMMIPRVASDPVGVWHVENAFEVPESITFEGIPLKAHTLVATIRASVELFEDSRLVNEVILNSLTKALGLQLDQALLRGTGTTMPLGVRNTPGVTVVNAAAGAGAVITREMISTACQAIWSANGTPNAVIMSPREYGILDRLQDTLYQPLRSFPSYDQLSKQFTTSIPITLDSLVTPATQTTSELYVGDFSELVARSEE